MREGSRLSRPCVLLLLALSVLLQPACSGDQQPAINDVNRQIDRLDVAVNGFRANARWIRARGALVRAGTAATSALSAILVEGTRSCPVQIGALEVLAEVADPGGVEGLLTAAFVAPSLCTRGDAAEMALKKLAHVSVEPLTRVLERLSYDPYNTRVHWASLILHDVGWSPSDECLGVKFSMALGDWHSVAQASPTPCVIDALIAALEAPPSWWSSKVHTIMGNGDSCSVEGHAVDALAAIGASAVPRLLESFASQRVCVRDGAMTVLGAIGDPRAVEPLFRDFQAHACKEERVAKTLGDMGTKAVPRFSFWVFEDPTPEVRSCAMKALAWMQVDVVREVMATQDLGTITRLYRDILGLALPGTEDILIKALEQHGNAAMAEVFLNCGNETLEQAGRRWAERHGYSIGSWPAGPHPRWGDQKR